MPIPIQYRKSSEAGIVSYDWVDIKDGFGYVDLYPAVTASGGATYILSETVVNSYTVESTASTWTFDSATFNLPRIVDGVARVYFSAGIATNGGTSSYLTIDIKKVDKNGSATTIGTEQSANIASAAGDQLFNILLNIPVSKTNFGKGDRIRVLVTETGTATVYLGHDPANRAASVAPAILDDPTNYPTKSTISIPFDVDL